jgi:hypothetical protein
MTEHTALATCNASQDAAGKPANSHAVTTGVILRTTVREMG